MEIYNSKKERVKKKKKRVKTRPVVLKKIIAAH